MLDNYLRKTLAWTVTERFDPSNTCQVLLAAGKHLVTAGRPLLYSDSGVESVNSAVDTILLTACLDRIPAQVEVAFFQFALRGILEVAEASMVVLEHLGHDGTCPRIGGILHQRAQYQDAASSVWWADA